MDWLTDHCRRNWPKVKPVTCLKRLAKCCSVAKPSSAATSFWSLRGSVLISQAHAVVLYSWDAREREAAAAAGQDVSRWPQADAAQLHRYRQVAFASMFFAFPGVRPDTLQKALACVPAPCVAIGEGLGASRSVGKHESPDHTALLKELGAKYACEPALLERASQSSELPAQVVLNDFHEGIGGAIPGYLKP